MVQSFPDSDLGETIEKMLQALLRNGKAWSPDLFPAIDNIPPETPRLTTLDNLQQYLFFAPWHFCFAFKIRKYQYSL